MTSAPGQDWLSRYRRMAELMYEARRKVPRLGILGTSILHPRFPVPADHLDLMKTLEAIDQGACSPKIPSVFHLVAQWMAAFLYAARDGIHLLHLKIRFSGALRGFQKEPADLVIKSWCFGSPSQNGSGDFYYGTLGEELQKRGVRFVFLYGDARGRMTRELTGQILGSQKVRMVPEPLLIPLWAPFVTIWRQLSAALELRRLAKESRNPSFSAVCAAAASNGVKPAAVRHALYFYIGREAAKIFKPRAFITLYEGQPWEKLAWQGAKEGSARCRIVGYQHTVVMPSAVSLLAPNRSSWEMAVPDAVLCLGEATRRMLSPGHAPFGTPMVTFGSFRKRPDSGRQVVPQPGRRTVLVLPMGVLEEAVVLFDFAVSLSKSDPEDRFLFRCHPVLPFSRVLPHLSEGPEGCLNIELSTAPDIVSDFSRSSMVLYHGSSAVLYAVLHGLKPLYLETEKLPDTDPLFELEGWRVRISSAEEARRRLDSFAHLSPEEVRSDWGRASSYVEGYTQPADGRSVEAFLDAVGMGQRQGVPS